MKNTLTFRLLDSALLHKAHLNENDVIPALRVQMINNKLFKIYRLLDGLNDPWYHKQSLSVTVAGDVEFIPTASITSYTASTNTIVRATGTWKLGETLACVINNGSGVLVASFIGIVASGAGTATAVLNIIGTDADKGANVMNVVNYKSPAAAVIDISAIYLKDVLKIYDNGYTGGKVRIFTPIKDPAIFAVLHRDPYFDGRVAYFHRGDTIELYVGPSATALGTVNVEYRGKPTPCADFDTDVLVDLPPEENQVLMDEVLSEYLQAANKEVPPDVATRTLEFQKRYEAAMTDLQKTQSTIKGQRGG